MSLQSNLNLRKLGEGIDVLDEDKLERKHRVYAYEAEEVLLSEPLPQSFETIDEFVEFWDTHSIADYPEAFREIKGEVNVQHRRYYRVALESHVGAQLAEQAHAQGLTLDALVNQMLKEYLHYSS